MAANRSTGKIPVGTPIVVKPGVASPDFPDVSFAGWTGVVAEHAGKKTAPRYIVEWDAAVGLRCTSQRFAEPTGLVLHL